MKFDHYSLEDFLSDKDFVEWVKGGESLEKHIYFSQWINSMPNNLNSAYLAREIILSLKSESLSPNEDDYNEVLSSIISLHHKKSFNQSFLPKINSFQIGRTFWIKAAVFFLIGAFSIVLFLMNNNVEQNDTLSNSIKEVLKENPKGQRSTFQLPDGSMVSLNAESQVRYMENFSKDSRVIELIGEAYFEVEKDTLRPFIVKSGQFTTTALGTAFNVNAYNYQREIEVSLVHGKVEVKDSDSQSNIILNPGERVVGNKISRELNKSLFKYEEKISWKDGVIFFNSASLEEVIAKLEKWYNVKFEILSYPKGRWVYNGSFKKLSLSQVLDRMSFTEGFEYEISNKIVTLKFDQNVKRYD